MALFCLYWQLIGGGFLQQVYFKLINKPEPAPHFTERCVYKAVRHPIQLGTLIGLWATPAMSMTHLLLSATLTAYVLIAISCEEKDLATTWAKTTRVIRSAFA